MAIESAISWTDATFNPWIGCTKVSPACDHCYAESDNKRRGWVAGWGPGVPRRRTAPSNWAQPLKWQRQHFAFWAEHGRRRRVFCASLADVFDNEVPQEWRLDLWSLIRQTPDLRWLLLTKRIGNAEKMLPADWGSGYCNVALGATMADQEEWDRDLPKLMRTPAAIRFVSAEPLLGQIDIVRGPLSAGLPNWIISGGESGPQRRELNMGYVRLLRDQCASFGIAFHHKQNGGLRGKDGGCLVDGVEHKAFPEALAA